MLKAKALAKTLAQIAKHSARGVPFEGEMGTSFRKAALRTWAEFPKVKQAEYSGLRDVNVDFINPNMFSNTVLRGKVQGPIITEGKRQGQRLFPYKQKLAVDYYYGNPGTVWHEFTHARQFYPRGYSAFGKESKLLGVDVIANPYEYIKSDLMLRISEKVPYIVQPIERHASWVANKVKTGEMPFDEAFEKGAEKFTIYARKQLTSKYDEAMKELSEESGMTIGRITRYLLGAGLALISGGLLMPEEAEAGMKSKFLKTFGKKAAKRMGPVFSSGMERYKGYKIPGTDKVIESIEKAGKWRVVKYTDGTKDTITIKEANSLYRGLGTDKYMNKLVDSAGETLHDQAMASLKMHKGMAKSYPFMSRGTFRMHHKSFLQDLNKMAKDLPPDTVFVAAGDLYFQMPRVYAEYLEGTGYLKIIAGKSERKIVEPYKKKLPIEWKK